jgi:cytoskeletal protein CcmA (bactofilin family)
MALFGPKKRDIFSDRDVKQEAKKQSEKPVEKEVKPEKPKINEGVIKMPTSSALITECMNTKGEMRGCGSIIIEGAHTGDILMEETVIVSKTGSVDGTIKATNIKISGEVKGVLECDILEITKGSKLHAQVYNNTSYIDGFVEGEIYSSESVEINANGRLTLEECRSKVVKVTGKLSGRVVASQMLEVIRGGSIEGEIVTKGIKTLDGGSVVGTIVTYDEKIHSDQPKNAPKKKTLTPEEKAKEEEDKKKRELKDDVAELIDVDQIDVEKYAPKEGEEH